MPPELTAVLSVAIPSLIAVGGTIFGIIFVRRSNREQNDTNAFQAVTDQLFKLNSELNQRITNLESEVQTVKAEVLVERERANRLEEELEDTDDRLREQIGIASQLANYIKKLISAWPGPTPPPAPDPPFDWQKHL